MTCFSPLRAWRGSPTSEGKASIVFKRSLAHGIGSEINLPCGQCIGCKLERSRQWAVRCVHESKLYEDNVFVTFTYSDDFLPWDGSVDVRHFQLFMKRLRKHFNGRSIRFFHCGEYGEKLGRPHYHAILFNIDFEDKKLYSSGENNVYTSALLDKLWGLGQCMIGAVSFDSAAYVARYCTKKITGKDAEAHYVNRDTGCVLRPEYITMSRRPGIGRGFYDKFKRDIFPSDEVVIRGVSTKPPRFYDSIYEVEDPMSFEAIKISRVKSGVKSSVSDDGIVGGENFSDRLAVREKVVKARIGSLTRKLESE